MNPADTWFLIYIGAVIALALAVREFWCWYFKLNQMVRLLTSIDESLKHPRGVRQPE